jgi:transketolase
MALHPESDTNIKSSKPPRRKLANAIRALAMDAVQAANSGHPGAPMGMADIAEVLWNDYLKHSPSNPLWINRDRFVLSNGHGSMLQYALAHLTGYPLSIEELRDFRQLGSRTAGHPEYEPEIGIETTTGPLGQGITNGVGMALAEKVLAAQFNRPDYEVIDHHTYVFLGDGCLMEGISHEACSLAGTLKLGKLVCFYDDNGISIDGEVQGWFTDDTPARFEAYGWHVVAAVDGHDSEALQVAINQALASDKPSLICCKTIIGFGSPNKQGTEATHGAPLGADEIAATRKALDWKHPPFEIPLEVKAGWDAHSKGDAAETTWKQVYEAYAVKYPDLAAELQRRMAGNLPADWASISSAKIKKIALSNDKNATRKASLITLNAFASHLPELIGGSADLTGSNLTEHSSSKWITGNDANGNYISFGVREFGMAAMLNGMALHGGFIPYGGTFLTFSDYARNALRMSALMKIQNILVFTHDSIGLGEDGPTHQPVEHVASLRLMPNMSVWRPCDTTETAVAWKASIENRKGPSSLILSRQGLPAQSRSEEQLANIHRGGYVLRDVVDPQAIIIATGSEVEIAIVAAKDLESEGIPIRVVSMPCVEAFDDQERRYRDSVLPPMLDKRVVVEAGVTEGWYRFVGFSGRVVGLDRFGESAPASELFEKFGFTADNIKSVIKDLL